MIVTEGWGFVWLTLFNLAVCVMLPRFIALNPLEAIENLKSQKSQKFLDSQRLAEHS